MICDSHSTLYAIPFHSISTYMFLGRLTCVTWWLGTVIIVSTYTANLASLLTASRSQKSIESVEDLAVQSNVKYGNHMS